VLELNRIDDGQAASGHAGSLAWSLPAVAGDIRKGTSHTSSRIASQQLSTRSRSPPIPRGTGCSDENHRQPALQGRAETLAIEPTLQPHAGSEAAMRKAASQALAKTFKQHCAPSR